MVGYSKSLRNNILTTTANALANTTVAAAPLSTYTSISTAVSSVALTSLPTTTRAIKRPNFAYRADKLDTAECTITASNVATVPLSNAVVLGQAARSGGDSTFTSAPSNASANVPPATRAIKRPNFSYRADKIDKAECASVPAAVPLSNAARPIGDSTFGVVPSVSSANLPTATREIKRPKFTHNHLQATSSATVASSTAEVPRQSQTASALPRQNIKYVQHLEQTAKAQLSTRMRSISYEGLNVPKQGSEFSDFKTQLRVGCNPHDSNHIKLLKKQIGSGAKPHLSGAQSCEELDTALRLHSRGKGLKYAPSARDVCQKLDVTVARQCSKKLIAAVGNNKHPTQTLARHFSRAISNESINVHSTKTVDDLKTQPAFENGVVETKKTTKKLANAPAANSSQARPTNLALHQKNSALLHTYFEPEIISTQKRGGRIVAADDIGRHVLVSGEKTGILKFHGHLKSKTGIWCGVDLGVPEGLNDGSLEGICYFKCKPAHGVLAPVHKVQISEEREPADKLNKGYSDIACSSTVLSHGLSELELIAADTTPTLCSTASIKQFSERSIGYTQLVSKQNSFEQDESLGILTPDQVSMFNGNEFSHHDQTPSMDFLPNDGTLTFVRISNEICPNFITDQTNQCLTSSFSSLNTNLVQALFQESEVSDDAPSRAVGILSNPKVQQDVISDHTLSPEELPMDPPSPHQTHLKTSVSDELKADLFVSGSPGPSSRSHPPSVSIVTSVTSIGSVDADGYAGDGELSRPASRNTCYSPSHLVQRQPPVFMQPYKAGTTSMTDSDFFTESDADVHEDVNLRVGDRRAQVIDGTLYNNSVNNNGTAPNQQQRCPSFTASINEEMESSGIYSDLERKPDDTNLKLVGAEMDVSPDGSTKTVSSKTEASQVKESDHNMIGNMTDQSNIEFIHVSDSLIQENNAKNLVDISLECTLVIQNNSRNLILDPDRSDEMLKEMNTTCGSTTSSVTSKTSKKAVELKNHPMPKRNVGSKVKALLDSTPTGRRTTCDTPSPKVIKTPRPGRWDAVMTKIAQGQADSKLKPDRLKEVKSKVFAETPVVPVPAAKRKAVGLSNSSAKKENVTPLGKAKSRRGRTRASSTSSGHQTTPGQKQHIDNSSARSSLSDVSVNHCTPNAAKTLLAAQIATRRSVKKHGRSTSPTSDVSTNSAVIINRNPSLAQQKSGAGAGAVSEMKTPRRSEKHKLVRDHNRYASGNKPPSTVLAVAANDAAPTITPVPVPEVPHPSIKALEAATIALQKLQHDQKSYVTGFDAMNVVCNHLVMKHEAHSSHFQSQLAVIKEREKELIEVMDAMEEKLLKREEEIFTVYTTHDKQLKKLKETHRQQVDTLETEAKQNLNELKKHLETEQQASYAKYKATADAQHQQQMGQLQSRYDLLETQYNELQRKEHQLIEALQQDKDTRLKATASRCKELQDDVNSLKTVLELSQKEVHEMREKNELLRIDSDELPLVQRRASALQARVEDLEVQLKQKKDEERKLAAECSKINDSFTQESLTSKRLLQANEELKWKLMHNVRNSNQMSPLNTSQVAADAPEHDRTNRSLPDTSYQVDFFQSPVCSNILERSDSVSYTLHVDDAMDEALNRSSKLMKSASFKRAGPRSSPSWSPKTSTPAKNRECSSSAPSNFSGLVYESSNMLRSSSSSTSTGNSSDEKEREDLDEANLLPTSSGSNELNFITPHITVPKDSAGEAMVSEETSEEENSIQLSDEESSSEIQ